MAQRLPRGRVTFAFVDVVQSTRNFIEHGDRYVTALAELHARVAGHTESREGVVVETEGDGAFLAFPDADAAVTALCALQHDLETNPTAPVPLRLRAGAHTGQADPVGAGYVALPVYVAARVAAASAAGQVLVSDTTHADLASSPADDLGLYALKDVADPVRLWRVHGDTTSPRASPARRTNVQEPHTAFIGRAGELEDLTGSLARQRLVTVVGPGGVGKTRLVSQWALDAAKEDTTVWLAELATASAPDHVLPVVASACSLSARDPEDLVRALAARGPFVLVLDNCEHLIDAVVPLVATLLDQCAEARVICTSREPLGMPEERVRRLGPIATDEAAALFRQRSMAAGCSAETLTGPVVEDVCESLDRLPLALELAALHAGTVPTGSLVQVVRDEVATLSRRGVPDRQRSIDAMLAWSLQLLTPVELDGLLASSLWPGRFDDRMAHTLLEGVSSTSAGTLRELVRKNLVDLDHDHYRVLFPIREAARARLARRPELHRRARSSLVAWAIGHARNAYGGDGNYDDEPIDRVLALEQALTYDRELRTADIAWVWELLRVVAHHTDTSHTLRTESENALAEGPPTDLRAALVHAAALRVMTFYGESCPLPAAHLDAIIDVVRGSECPAVLTTSALSAVAWQLDLEGRSDDALVLWQEAAAIVEGDPHLTWARPGAIGAIATNRSIAGDLDTAIEVGRTSVETAQRLGVVRDLNIQHGNLAEILLEGGRPAEAVEHALKAVQLTPVDGPTRQFFLRTLATAYWRSGDTESATTIATPLVQQLRDRAPNSPFLRAQLELLLGEIPVLAPTGP